MQTSARAEQLTIYLSQKEHRGRAPDYVNIVEQARRAGLAGATVLQGLEGYGASGRAHHRKLAVGEDLPVVVIIVDDAEQIEAFLARIGALLAKALVLRQPTEVVVKRVGRGRGGAG